MPGLHTKGGRAGTVDGRRIAERRQQKSHIGVVRKAHIPFGFRSLQSLKIHMAQDFAHQLSAAAGNENVIFLFPVIFHQLRSALLRRIADADALVGPAVGSQVQTVSQFLKGSAGVLKTGPVRFHSAAKRRSHKADSAACGQIFRVSHKISYSPSAVLWNSGSF